jgi:MoaA/NifB/PqqE/SkfB family radical SAM enzyme
MSDLRAAARRAVRRARSTARSLTAGPRDDGAADPPKPFDSACYAPTVSMYFDQFGNVRACCQNTEALMGNVAQHSIREIWESAATRRMRAALRRNDFSEGCGFCQWQVDQGDDEIVFARIFDEHPVAGEHPEWPVQMEFSMTNSCNLQCVMCNGDWSSSIRAHREHRAPLPEVYGEAFFDELAEFLPHLRKTNFLGGEPFLGKEPLRVLGMLAELDRPPDVAVTTNGTQWSDRIEAICERLPISFVLSLDGITRSTYESIRVGADFDRVMANLDRFQAYAERHGTMVTLAHCLMRPNWHEFSRLLRFAEDRGMEVGMNEVLFPVELSLFQLPPADLRQVVETMERDDGGIAASLDLLRPVWDGQLAALRHRLESLEGGQVQFIRPWGGDDGPDWERAATDTLTEWVGDEAPTRLELDRSSGTTRITGRHDQVLVAAGALDARTAAEVVQALSAMLPSPVTPTRPSSSLIHDLVLGEDDGSHPLQLRIVWRDIGDCSTVLVALRNPPPPPVLPDDPLREMSAWCGPDRVVALTLDVDDRVEDVDGNTAAIGLGAEDDVLGRTSEELIEALALRHGSPRLEPGPSGRSADAVVTFGAGAGTPILRVMTERGPAGAVVLVGREDPARERRADGRTRGT